MRKFRLVSSATIAAVLVSAAAVAQSAMADRQAVYVSPTGSQSVLTANAKGHDMIMKHGRELPAGAIVYRNGGKLYVVEDRKMPNGAMLFADMEDWFDRAKGNIK
ncbi:hypothetical protein [Rhodoplanes azumiensis]|uniref:Uncharacterized protein n=1 Tax=Rhodoplanes azumiensis TaxID=1897628 RepID=A0ABW5AL80_9BRAD